jgi:hypothetical protein
VNPAISEKWSCFKFTTLYEVEQRLKITKMSDIAPFVGAVLRDKVIQELNEEVEALRAEVYKYRTVEITGPLGFPVHTSRQFTAGHRDQNPNLWLVEFREPNKCTFKEFRVMEIRVGGITKAEFSNTSLEGFPGGGGGYSDGMARIPFCFGSSSGLWLFTSIEMSEEVYLTLHDIDPDTTFETLTELCADDARVVFHSISFMNKNINGAMEIWGIDN